MVTLTIQDIVEKIKSHIKGHLTREDLNVWAFEMINLEDRRLLEYLPRKKEKMIWDLLVFIAGYDLQTEPGEYLHSLENLVDCCARNGIGFMAYEMSNDEFKERQQQNLPKTQGKDFSATSGSNGCSIT